MILLKRNNFYFCLILFLYAFVYFLADDPTQSLKMFGFSYQIYKAVIMLELKLIIINHSSSWVPGQNTAIVNNAWDQLMY